MACKCGCSPDCDCGCDCCGPSDEATSLSERIARVKAENKRRDRLETLTEA